MLNVLLLKLLVMVLVWLLCPNVSARQLISFTFVFSKERKKKNLNLNLFSKLKKKCKKKYGNEYFAKYAEPVPSGETTRRLANLAKQHNVLLIGGSQV